MMTEQQADIIIDLLTRMNQRLENINAHIQDVRNSVDGVESNTSSAYDLHDIHIKLDEIKDVVESIS